ncbi:hypothetical protein C8A01DRAFT_36224 [Parachaetomium inaequale]|uniref:Uncharacterized protein n=1 Tax=Parachaetomium inaequale TaxID=2588326 RepID=A0AAN6PF08_9PEZI|nr:hypothetical protein C8A01DRAFT_36224 [Parachaetomium inaequale]
MSFSVPPLVQGNLLVAAFTVLLVWAALVVTRQRRANVAATNSTETPPKPTTPLSEQQALSTSTTTTVTKPIQIPAPKLNNNSNTDNRNPLPTLTPPTFNTPLSNNNQNQNTNTHANYYTTFNHPPSLPSTSVTSSGGAIFPWRASFSSLTLARRRSSNISIGSTTPLCAGAAAVVPGDSVLGRKGSACVRWSSSEGEDGSGSSERCGSGSNSGGRVGSYSSEGVLFGVGGQF